MNGPNYSLDFTGYILQSSTSSSCIYGTNFVLHSVSDTRQQTYRNNLHTVCVMRQTDRVHSTCGRATHVITYTHQQTDTLEYGDYTAVRTCKHSQTPRQAREQTRDRRRRTPAHDTVRRHTYTPTHLPTYHLPTYPPTHPPTYPPTHLTRPARAWPGVALGLGPGSRAPKCENNMQMI